jgi:hypothetical protein
MKYTEALGLAIKALASEMNIYKQAWDDWQEGDWMYSLQADLYNKLDDAREKLIEKHDELKMQE